MTVPYTIRRAVTADAPSIAEIAVSAYRGYVAVMGREPAPMRADFQAHIDIDMVFVADATDGIAGYVVLCEINGDWWLDNIATAPRHHGRPRRRAPPGPCDAHGHAVARARAHTHTRQPL